MRKFPIEIETAFVDAIDSAAQRWKDDIIRWVEFRKILMQMCKNIYESGQGGNFMKRKEVSNENHNRTW